jgi:hypothetical protein
MMEASNLSEKVRQHMQKNGQHPVVVSLARHPLRPDHPGRRRHRRCRSASLPTRSAGLCRP